MCCFLLMNLIQVTHVNIDSLRNKVTDVSVFANQQTCHILGVSESHLNDNISDATLKIPNYTILRRDAAGREGHTGIAVYIHNSILPHVKRRADLESKDIESFWLELKPDKSAPVYVGFVYRNPNSKASWVDHFENMMDNVHNRKSDIHLLGDLNIDLLKHDNFTWKSTCSFLGLKQLIDQPTRITKSSATLIDHIYTTNSDKVSNVQVHPESMSDHCPISLSLALKLKKQVRHEHKTISFRSFKFFNKENFLQDLALVPFSEVYNFNDPNQALTHWYSLFRNVLDKHAPLRTKRVREERKPPWLTEDIRKAMELRNQLKSNGEFEEYKRQRRAVRTMVRQAQRKHADETIAEGKNTQALWKVINSVTKGKKQKSTSIPNNLSADVFNNHFLNIAHSLTKLNNTDPDQYDCNSRLRQHCHRPNLVQFSIPLMTTSDVRRHISKLKNSSSCGHDEIPSHILKLSLPLTVEHLTYIFNLCIKHNCFPDAFKMAKVIPLPKSKDLNNLNEYRPISVLPILSKPLERHIHTHLLKYLDRNNLLTSNQSGFRPGHSCQSALTQIIDNWLLAMNNEQLSGAIYLDLKKAFDLVNHTILLKKLHLYNLDPRSLMFFTSYLNNRCQKVYLNGRYSSEGQVTCGVPQGSILGPLLFIIFINDLPLSLTNQSVKCDLFADDTTLHTSGKSVNDVTKSLQKSLGEVSTWCKHNKMIISIPKTKSMLITTRQKHQKNLPPLQLLLDNNPIEQVKEHRLLGITIDDKLSWVPHINNVCKTLQRNLFLLSKLKHLVDCNGRKLFFHAFIKSHCDYISNIWDGSNEVHLKKVISLYRRGVKLTQPGCNSTDEKFDQLKLLPLTKQHEFNKLVLMHKIVHGKSPAYLRSLITRSQRENTRHSLFQLPKVRIDIFKASLSFSGSDVWNNLPRSLKKIRRLQTFKDQTYKYLLNVKNSYRPK